MVQGLQKLFGKIGDLQKPLGEFALFNHGAGAPAASVDHLFVGQYRLIDRIPVDEGDLALHQAGLHEVNEHGLFVAIVGGIAGGDLAAPIQRQAHGFELAAHGGNIFIGPGFGMHAALDGGVFSRHAEGVPAHGMKHIEAAGPLEARNDVAHRVIAHMAHVDAPGGVRKHFQNIILGPGRIFLRFEATFLGPKFLPAGFCLAGIISFRCHSAWSLTNFTHGARDYQSLKWPASLAISTA